LKLELEPEPKLEFRLIKAKDKKELSNFQHRATVLYQKIGKKAL